MAPEALTGTVNEKSDVWSLGCIFHEFCTLKQTFAASTSAQTKERIQNEPFDPISPDYSPELRELIWLMLKKDPTVRPTVAELLEKPVV
jgi:NIMA (never in mitosis gene a)-related kinase